MDFEQTLYYWNIPGVEDKKGFLEPFFNNFRYPGFSKFFSDNPTIVWTGLDSIPLENLTDVGINFNNLDEIDFFLYEPSTYYHINKPFNCGHYHEDKWEENTKLRSKELDSLSVFQKTFNLKINVFTADYNINKYFKEFYPNLNMSCKDVFLQQVGNKTIQRINFPLSKKFYCNNKRFALHRALIMAHLQDKDGNFSWPYNIIDIDYTDYAWIEEDKLNLKDKFNLLKNKTFKIDNNQIFNVENFGECGLSPDIEHSHGHDIIKAYSESVIAIINETRFGQPTGYFSEKIFYAIGMDMPFILVAPPFTLEYLKKFGFKSFLRLWDESYDTITNHSERMKKIMDLIDWLDSHSLEDLIQMRENVKDIIEHNKRVLQEFRFRNLNLT